MQRLFAGTSSIVVRIIIAAVLLVSPAAPLLLRASAAPAPSTPTLLPAGSVSFETTTTSVTATGTLDVTSRVKIGPVADSLTAMLQLRRPNGRLIYQKTLEPTGDASGTVLFRWERPLTDLDLAPGRYPITLTVNADRNGETAQQTIGRELFVYSGENGRANVALVVRVTGVPMSDPEGRFVTDPALNTQTRDDVRLIADAVVKNPRLRVSLAIPPVILEEWKRIAGGYELSSTTGVKTIPDTDPVPAEYKRALDALGAAVGTKRLELLGQPYSDPNLYDLRRMRLLNDIAPQLDLGLSSVFTALETTPSAGLAPASWLTPLDAAGRLAQAGVAYTVVTPDSVKSGDATVTSGAYPIRGVGVVALVTDPDGSQAIASADSSATYASAFTRQISEEASSPLVYGVQLGPGESATAAGLMRTLTLLTRVPYARIVNARYAASAPATQAVSLTALKVPDTAPRKYWADVREARNWAKALDTATRPGDKDSDASTADTLIAEASAWAGPDNEWGLADRGRAFASSGQRISEDVLKRVSIKVENVTLPGTRGEVPVSIRNNSGRALKVTIETIGDGLVVSDENRRVLELKPAENFITVPVDMKTGIRATLRVRVLAPPEQLASSSVTVRASYLDRLALIGGIVVVLFVLLIFIVRRVRAAEARDDQRESSEAPGYTDTIDPSDDEDRDETRP